MWKSAHLRMSIPNCTINEFKVNWTATVKPL